MTIARVFPRRTKATPDDSLAFIGAPPFKRPIVDEVHVSATFTWELEAAEQIARLWKDIAPVSLGGPATGQRGEKFTPGMYIKNGYTITSRGCPNNCWFCSVPKRDGNIRELPICDGWNVLDDNLLACSDKHIIAVFDMLHLQKQRVEFTGGLEAARLKPWHVHRLAFMKPKQMFFAYDTPDDYEPLRCAGKMLLDAGFTRASHALRCYVLIGWPSDTLAAAEARLVQALECGFTPMAMLWRNKQGDTEKKWCGLQRQWARPAIIHSSIPNTQEPTP